MCTVECILCVSGKCICVLFLFEFLQCLIVLPHLSRCALCTHTHTHTHNSNNQSVAGVAFGENELHDWCTLFVRVNASTDWLPSVKPQPVCSTLRGNFLLFSVQAPMHSALVGCARPRAGRSYGLDMNGIVWLCHIHLNERIPSKYTSNAVWCRVCPHRIVVCSPLVCAHSS